MKKEDKKVGQPTPESWELTDEEKLSYQSLYVLYLMVEGKVVFPNFLSGKLKYTQRSIDFLESKKLITQSEKITEGKKVLGVKVQKSDVDWVYEPTKAAKEIVEGYRRQYRDFLSFYDVYGHVDPEAGEFALSRYAKILLKQSKKKVWEDYKKHPRWMDYRVPVAVYKGLDPREYIFFSFMEEGRYIPTEEDTDHQWAENLFLEEIWEELYNVLHSAPKWEAQGDDETPAAEIMENIINAGAEVLRKQQKKLKKYIKKQDDIIKEIDGHNFADGEHQSDYDDYYDDPVYYQGTYHYTPLSDPLFWGAAILFL